MACASRSSTRSTRRVPGVPATAARSADRRTGRRARGLDAWITGLRASKPHRAVAPKLAYDERRGVWKASRSPTGASATSELHRGYDLRTTRSTTAATARSAAPVHASATAGGTLAGTRRPSAHPSRELSGGHAVDLAATATGSSQMSRFAGRSTTHALRALESEVCVLRRCAVQACRRRSYGRFLVAFSHEQWLAVRLRVEHASRLNSARCAK